MEIKKNKASVLAVSMIILGVILTIALSVALVSLKVRVSSMSEGKSNIAMQNAQSGVEGVMMELTRKKGDMTKDTVGDVCVSDAYRSASIYKPRLLDVSGNLLSCDDDRDTSKWFVASIKSVGIGQGQQRAIEAANPCYGADIDSDLVGWWKFDGDAKDSNGIISRNDATLGKDSGNKMPSFEIVDGRNAITFNDDSSSRNYASIEHKDEYAKPAGTISFWFRLKNADNKNQWIFSKDRNNCYTDKCMDEKCGGSFPCDACDNICHFSSGTPGYDINDDYCDCGHVSFLWKRDRPDIWSDYKGLDVRLQNEGDGAIYQVGDDTTKGADIESKTWHLATLTVDNSKQYILYIDAIREGIVGITKDKDSVLEGLINNEVSISLGRYDTHIPVLAPDDKMWYFEGSMDDLRIYKRALTQCDITRLFNET